MPDDNLANFASNVGDTVAVGSYPAGASPYGALNMAGNVSEWTANWFEAAYYNLYPVDSWPNNPAGLASGSYRVLKGGSWLYAADSIRVSDRAGGGPGKTYNSIGFRCAVWSP